MSANNYTLVHEINSKFYVWQNLNAEEAVENKILTSKNASKEFDTPEAAYEWAIKNDDSEYGISLKPFKPKDFFREIIVKEEG